MEMESNIEIRDLSIGYNKKRSKPKIIIPSINLFATYGNLIGLVGINGSGKTTLLKTIAGLVNSINGDILINSKSISLFSLKQLAGQLSFVGTHQDIHLMMPVHQVVAYGRYPYTNLLGTLQESDKSVIKRAMIDTGIYHLRDSYIGEISDGEKQRVLIARSLAQDTKIILLDEPTAFLDVRNKFEILHLLQKLAHEQKKLIIFSSHDLQITLNMVDLIWFVDNKKIISGFPEELVLSNQINSLFDNSDVYFDAEQNDFKVKKNYEYNVSLIGNGISYVWTKRAFERNNISVSDNKSNIEVSVIDKDNQIFWDIKTKNNQEKVNSLIKLLDKIKNISSK